MKKLLITLSILFFLFLFYIWWCRISLSNYFYKQLNNVYNMSGDFISIPKTNPNHPVVFMYPVSQNENLNIQVTGGTIVGFFAVYNTFWFNEYKLSIPEGDNISSLNIDTGKPIRNLVRWELWNPIKDFLIYNFESFLKYSIFDRWGSITHLWILVYRNTTWNVEIMKIK